MTVKKNKITLNVITSDNEILFIDENGNTLTWELNDINLVDIASMIKAITG